MTVEGENLLKHETNKLNIFRGIKPSSGEYRLVLTAWINGFMHVSVLLMIPKFSGIY
jgi:hypothetical protein